MPYPYGPVQLQLRSDLSQVHTNLDDSSAAGPVSADPLWFVLTLQFRNCRVAMHPACPPYPRLPALSRMCGSSCPALLCLPGTKKPSGMHGGLMCNRQTGMHGGWTQP